MEDMVEWSGYRIGAYYVNCVGVFPDFPNP